VTESARFAPLSTDPAYRRIAQIITARITDRTLPEGQPLPTELELAGQFGVTRSTVREALRELESRGLVARRRGTKRLTVARPTTASVAAQVSNALVLHDVTVLEVWEALTLLVPPTASLAARRRPAAAPRAWLKPWPGSSKRWKARRPIAHWCWRIGRCCRCWPPHSN
jgi:GntR family transcriptional repressor for pyruvate dehydrogenase complex